VRVIDFSMLTPGAFASQILADLGATVLKIERPGTGDLERITVPAYFRAYNRGKGSAVIDLATSAGHAEAMGLVAAADVLIDGFRPGVMDRLGLGFDQVREVRDTIVYCSINGLGSEGPFAQDRGHDSDFMARCEPAEVADYIKANAPYYFVPRYIDFVEALPLNGHGRVMKNELSASRSAHRWDANAARYDLRRG
jgi:hypothetical protein